MGSAFKEHILCGLFVHCVKINVMHSTLFRLLQWNINLASYKDRSKKQTQCAIISGIQCIDIWENFIAMKNKTYLIVFDIDECKMPQ